MKLYHGTSERVARLALQEGLLPRDESGVESHWEDCPSGEEYVYLTAAYAGYFAMQATDRDEDGRWAIIEIDTDLLPDGDDLYPDEDFLEQVTRGQMLPAEWGIPLMTADPETGTMVARTKWFRENLWMFAHLWEDSIKGIGNCCHAGAIPPEAITRVSYIDPKEAAQMCLMAADPFISLMNYAICQTKYKALTRWFMGEDVNPADFGYGSYPTLDATNGLHGLPPEVVEQVQLMKEQYDQWAKMLANRAGVEVNDG